MSVDKLLDMNMDRLLDKAKAGKLSKSEHKIVFDALKEFEPGDTDPFLYTIIHILGRSYDRIAAPYIEPFLKSSDKMIRSIAFRALFTYMCLFEEYIDDVLDLIHSPMNADTSWLISICIGMVREYIVYHKLEPETQKKLEARLRELIEIVEKNLPEIPERIFVDESGEMDEAFYKDIWYEIHDGGLKNSANWLLQDLVKLSQNN